MTSVLHLLAVAAETEEVSDPGAALGIGAIALVLSASAVLIWGGYLVLSARRKRRAGETPANLQPYLSDDELENKRLTRVLGWAVIVAALLAIVLPVYYVNESKRQATAAEGFIDLDIEAGEHWYRGFECETCHGPAGVGGGAEHVEVRSGLTVSWSVPSLNDVFYRYDRSEVELVEVFGRSGTPMPGNGLEGGGAMTSQEIDQVMAYILSFQIPQEEVVAKATPAVDLANQRILAGATTVEGLIATQEAEIADIEEAPTVFEAIATMPTEVRALLTADGTCTKRSAESIGQSCGVPGTDTDRDGVTDAAELTLSGPDFAGTVDTTVLVRTVTAVAVDGDTVFVTEQVQNPDDPGLYGLHLDPDEPFTQTDPLTGEPVADLDRLDTWLNLLDTAHLTYGVQADRQQVFLDGAQTGLDFLLESQANQAWIPLGVEIVDTGDGQVLDVSDVAAEMNTVSAEIPVEEGEGMGPFTVTDADAERAVGLFNAYCSRCHTAGYSAGPAFQSQPGSGAWGPSLLDGRSVVQFPAFVDQVDFVIKGSEANVNYGINGIGTGRMPGFGASLTLADIMLIVAYERTL